MHRWGQGGLGSKMMTDGAKAQSQDTAQLGQVLELQDTGIPHQN